ncbi:MAG: class I SAM-dependent methyltransferase [Nanoarchaeota archaeon]|nr:class I SAM-dependent methyltransferase [Nanoarchaeota archaeon]
MKQQLNFISSLHTATKREYLPRMNDNKVEAMTIAKKYGFDYWDGDRRYGYGGYKYIPGRWKPVAEKLIQQYHLPPKAKILDVGCGKAYLLFELQKLLPDAEVTGFDLSSYAINNAKEEVKPFLFVHRAEDKLPYHDQEFDLVLSINTLHNLPLYDVNKALQEIERVGKNKYLVVESYRNEQELFNLQCWALTAESFFTPQEWVWLLQTCGYSGDYEFIYFQ